MGQYAGGGRSASGSAGQDDAQTRIGGRGKSKRQLKEKDGDKGLPGKLPKILRKNKGRGVGGSDGGEYSDDNDIRLGPNGIKSR